MRFVRRRRLQPTTGVGRAFCRIDLKDLQKPIGYLVPKKGDGKLVSYIRPG